jgi:hypothetical protein
MKIKKVYEVRVNGKIHWIAADSKKALNNFFVNPRPTSIIARPDCNPDLSMFVL